MLIYWLLFLYFAVGALVTVGLQYEEVRRSRGLALVFGFFAMILIIGLRYKVGADWNNYVEMYFASARFDLAKMLSVGDPGYQFLNWFSYQVGTGIWFVNLLCALIFGWGLYRFCREQLSPWLAATVAIPYLVIVVAMGYTRQAVAVGILMAGLVQVTRGKSTLRFIPYVGVAALFHSTAVIMFPLVALAAKRDRLINITLVIFGSYLLYDVFVGNRLDKFMYVYVQSGYSSQGALIRIAQNGLAAFLYWVSARRLGFSDQEEAIWRIFSLAAVMMLLLYFVFPSSTAIDRMALYIIPLQVAVLTRVAYRSRNRAAGTIGVIAFLAAVQFVWLNFAQHAGYWVPYRLYPF